MASMTYDGRGFMLDGRRLWIVGGSIPYARIPRAQWRDRIHAAKLAGLNTISTPVVWSQHELRPGVFDFEGDQDLRHFVELIGEAGLYCILRTGPFVGDGYDFGGLPPWLAGVKDVAFRTHNQPFLEACSRYTTAVVQQFKDLQVTAPRGGGPVIMVQNEHSWTCGDDELARKYLGELDRYLREAGVGVPVVNANNLWTDVEGELDAWSGGDDLLAIVRQLGAVHPDHPRVVIDMPTCPLDVWGEAETAGPMPASLQRTLVEVLASGGQFSLTPFASGPNHGFLGGRFTTPSTEDNAAARYATQGRAHSAPLAEHGGPGPTFHAVRAVTTFASRFARVLAALDPDFRPIVLDPTPPADAPKAAKQTALSVIHADGSQGGVVFLIGPDPAGEGQTANLKPQSATLLLPDGSTLPVNTWGQGAAWCLFNVLLTPRARLDYCTFCALAQVGDVFVCVGAAGIEGRISVNGSPVDVAPAKGKQPVVLQHEGVTLVVLTHEQFETTHITDDGVYFDVAAVHTDGTPIPLTASRKPTRIEPDGTVSKVAGPTPARSPAKASMGDWSCASSEDYITGESPRYASIDGPGDLATLGAPYGYGWYRIRYKAAAAKKLKLIAPESADRLQILAEGAPVALIGAGPGVDALSEFTLAQKKGQHDLIILAENLGRGAGGTRLGEPKGLFGHIWEVQAFKAGKPKVEQALPVDPMDTLSPLFDHRKGDTTHPDRLTWSFTHRRKSPLIITLTRAPGRTVFLLNDTVIDVVETGHTRRLVLDQEQLNRGANTLQLALLTETDDPDTEAAAYHKAAAARLDIVEGGSCFTEKAEWALAKWEAPAASAYQSITKTAMNQQTGPTWWRTEFTPGAVDRPLYLEANGLTKGQIYLNGRHVGRYFVATRDGAAVPPQNRYILPAVWLNESGSNELVLFDEHGASPAKCHLTHGPADALLA